MSDFDNDAVPDTSEAFRESADELSVRAGGTIHFALDAGRAHALRVYWVNGSTGTWPRLPLGAGTNLPLFLDAYLLFTLQNPNTALLPTSLGFLDSMGRANTTLVLPPNTDPVLVGVTFHHAYFVGTLTGNILFASNSMPIRLIP